MLGDPNVCAGAAAVTIEQTIAATTVHAGAIYGAQIVDVNAWDCSRNGDKKALAEPKCQLLSEPQLYPYTHTHTDTPIRSVKL